MSRFKHRILKILLFSLMLSIWAGFPAKSFALADSLVDIVNPYKKVMRRHTQLGRRYNIDELSTRYKWYATYHSPDFLKAFNTEYFRLYPNGGSPYAKQLKASIEEKGKLHFIIGIYAKDWSLKRFEGPEDLWEISLHHGFQVLKPIEVKRLDKSSFLKHFYPYLKKWYYAYRVTFAWPMTFSLEEEFKLRLSSAGGVSEVKFTQAQ